MGASKVTKGELADFARQTAAYMEPFERRQRALEVCFDVLVTVLGVEAKVKAELDRRKAASNAIPKAVEQGKAEEGAGAVDAGVPIGGTVMAPDDDGTSESILRAVLPTK